MASSSLETSTEAAGQTRSIKALDISMQQYGRLTWHLRKQFPQGLEAVLADPEACFGSPGQFIKNSRVVTLSRFQLTSGRKQSRLIVRRLNYGKKLHRFRDLFRASRAQRAFRSALMFERAGISTPVAFAASDYRRFFWPVAAYLITEEIIGARTVAKYLSECRPTSSLVEDLGRLIAKMHEAGFSHRDLKLANILIDSQLKPYLIDLDGVRYLGQVTEARAIKDLARMWQGLKDYPGNSKAASRFLVSYCKQRHLQSRLKAFAAGILNQTN